MPLIVGHESRRHTAAGVDVVLPGTELIPAPVGRGQLSQTGARVVRQVPSTEGAHSLEL